MIDPDYLRIYNLIPVKAAINLRLLALAEMKPEDMASNELKKLREKFTKEAINDHQMAQNEGTVRDTIMYNLCCISYTVISDSVTVISDKIRTLKRNKNGYVFLW